MTAHCVVTCFQWAGQCQEKLLETWSGWRALVHSRTTTLVVRASELSSDSVNNHRYHGAAWQRTPWCLPHRL